MRRDGHKLAVTLGFGETRLEEKFGGAADGMPVVNATQFFAKGALTPKVERETPEADSSRTPTTHEQKRELIRLMSGGMSLREACRTVDIPYTTGHTTWARHLAQQKSVCSHCGTSLSTATAWYQARHICSTCHGEKVNAGMVKVAKPQQLLKQAKELETEMRLVEQTERTRIEEACIALGRVTMADLEDIPSQWRGRFASGILELLSICSKARAVDE